MHKLPHQIFSYIREHFREGHICDIKPSKNETGHISFKIKVNENDVLHHIEFNEKGMLTKHDTEPLFEEDYYEDEFYGSEKY